MALPECAETASLPDTNALGPGSQCVPRCGPKCDADCCCDSVVIFACKSTIPCPCNESESETHPGFGTCRFDDTIRLYNLQLPPCLTTWAEPYGGIQEVRVFGGTTCPQDGETAPDRVIVPPFSSGDCENPLVVLKREDVDDDANCAPLRDKTFALVFATAAGPARCCTFCFQFADEYCSESSSSSSSASSDSSGSSDSSYISSSSSSHSSSSSVVTSSSSSSRSSSSQSSTSSQSSSSESSASSQSSGSGGGGGSSSSRSSGSSGSSGSRATINCADWHLSVQYANPDNPCQDGLVSLYIIGAIPPGCDPTVIRIYDILGNKVDEKALLPGQQNADEIMRIPCTEGVPQQITITLVCGGIEVCDAPYIIFP